MLPHSSNLDILAWLSLASVCQLKARAKHTRMEITLCREPLEEHAARRGDKKTCAHVARANTHSNTHAHTHTLKRTNSCSHTELIAYKRARTHSFSHTHTHTGSPVVSLCQSLPARVGPSVPLIKPHTTLISTKAPA